MKDIKSHERINDIFLGPLERPALKWLAEHMPAWLTPDWLTLIGVAGSLIAFAGYWLALLNKNYLWLACLGFIINWFGDSLDGTVARHRHIERPQYGFFLDHIIDSVGMVLIFTGLGISGYVSYWVANAALLAYLLMNILVYLTTAVHGVYRISYSKLGPTELRALAILFNISLYFSGNPAVHISGVSISWGNMFVGFIGLLLIYFFITTSIQTGRELNKIDTDRQQSLAAKKASGRKSRHKGSQTSARRSES